MGEAYLVKKESVPNDPLADHCSCGQRHEIMGDKQVCLHCTASCLEVMIKADACKQPDPIYLIILGMPACGKGTQCNMAITRLGFQHFSTGDMLRSEIQKKTDLGLSIKATIDAGGYVTDEISNELIRNKLKEGPKCIGYIFDGYPRTMAQARWLNDFLIIDGRVLDGAIVLASSREMLVERIKDGRLVHSASGRTYNRQTRPPKREGLDDLTGEPLEPRADDTEEIFLKRLTVYREKTQSIEDFYLGSRQLFSINAHQSVEHVWVDICTLIRAFQVRKLAGTTAL